jgi:hypothetical protein
LNKNLRHRPFFSVFFIASLLQPAADSNQVTFSKVISDELRIIPPRNYVKKVTFFFVPVFCIPGNAKA